MLRLHRKAWELWRSPARRVAGFGMQRLTGQMLLCHVCQPAQALVPSAVTALAMGTEGLGTHLVGSRRWEWENISGERHPCIPARTPKISLEVENLTLYFCFQVPDELLWV